MMTIDQFLQLSDQLLGVVGSSLILIYSIATVLKIAKFFLLDFA